METTETSPVLQTFELGSPPWTTFDPFLFCVHHNDDYPAGDGSLAPRASLAGRQIGSDFSGRDGWSMYHGSTVPGFPQHPHRGFETVTFVRRGYIDHSDSLRAAARYGAGDVQWLTAGGGIVHAEMFPLLREDEGNPAEMFQIWLNLPRSHKMAEPYFAMLWAEDIPVFEAIDNAGRRAQVTVVAGSIGEHVPPSPPPDSWASQTGSDVAIWRVALDAGASWTLPVASDGTTRAVYVFEGGDLTVGSSEVPLGTGALLDVSLPLQVTAADRALTFLVLQGRPIGEPVAQYGPFVLNDRAGIEQAFRDYQRTGFGGWPWPDDAPTHGHVAGRFARRPDGSLELPPGTDPAQHVG
jgi:quercetin 2,3-dioxygenase